MAFHNAKALITKRCTFISLTYHKRVEGMTGIAAAPPAAATGMGEAGTLVREYFTAAEFENIAVYVV